MTTEKIYGPWIDWDGGECPVTPGTVVAVKFRSGKVLEPRLAFNCEWDHDDNAGDIVKYCTVTEQPDLEAAEKLLRENGYTVSPPAKPLTFEDVTPLMEAPPKGTEFWVISAAERDGVKQYRWADDAFDGCTMRHRMAYLEREHALVAARHIFGLKGGEL